jgi:hypothetical protein
MLSSLAQRYDKFIYNCSTKGFHRLIGSVDGLSGSLLKKQFVCSFAGAENSNQKLHKTLLARLRSANSSASF